MLFSSHDQDWLVPFWQEHITPTLGSKAARQFVRATQSPSNWLADTIIKPRLFCPDWLGAAYYPVDLDKFSAGRNHHLAKLIATDPGGFWDCIDSAISVAEQEDGHGAVL